MDKNYSPQPEPAANIRPTPADGPGNVCSSDLEDRQFDDNSEGIDWDEIIATTQDDFLAGRFSFDSADYPDEESANVAMMALMDALLQEVLNGIAAENSLDATRPQGHPELHGLCGSPAVGTSG